MAIGLSFIWVFTDFSHLHNLFYTPLQIGAFDIIVAYDPLLLAFNSATFGIYLGDPLVVDSYGNTLDVLIDTYLPTNGTVKVSEVSLLTMLPTQQDTFLLFTMNFDAIGAGTSPLLFDSVLLGDADGVPPTSQIDLKSGSIDVNPVPEPNTLLLLCAALGILMVWRRKFRS